MPTNAELLLLDTSAAIALVSPTHERHLEVRRRALGHQLGLAGHAAYETFSVLTRLPPPQRLSPRAAVRLIRHNFPATVAGPSSPPVDLLDTLAAHGLAGGTVYDALVAAAARAHNAPLLTLDTRALGTYAALGIRYDTLAP